MKDLSAELRDLLTRSDVQPFLLVEIGPSFTSQYFRYVTLPYDFIYNSNNYTSENGLVGLDPPRISKVLDKESYNLTIVDPLYALRPFFEGGDGQLIGIDIEIVGGFVNGSDSVLYGKAPGQVFDDFFTVYAGFVDNASYAVTEDEVLLTVEGASPMGPLDLTRTIRTSKEFIQRQHPTETGYNQLAEKSIEVILNWGKLE
jgi:hypothetical protein